MYPRYTPVSYTHLHLLQNRLGIPQEHPALRGQLHPVGAALKDSNTQAVFQLLDGQMCIRDSPRTGGLDSRGRNW